MRCVREAKTNAGHAFSGFQLTTGIVKNLKQFNLTPVAKLVLLELSTHYNAEKNGAVVFPSMQYIADTLGIGLTQTKKAIKDLINEGIIIKSKLGKMRGNNNKYLLTLKTQNLASEWPQNEFFKRPDSDRFMIETNNHEQNKKTTTVVFQKTKNKTVNLVDVPDIIRNNKKVIKPCAYWASLSEEVKKDYLQQDEKKKFIDKKRKEIVLKKQKEKIQLQEECRKPLNEQFTYESACNLIKSIANINTSFVEEGISKKLANIFDIDIEKLLQN